MINQERENKPYKEGFSKPYTGNYREDCSICSDNDAFTYKSWIQLGCSHFFHRHCIDLWIYERPTCPLCNENVYESYRRQLRLEASGNINWALLVIFLLFIIPLMIINFR